MLHTDDVAFIALRDDAFVNGDVDVDTSAGCVKMPVVVMTQGCEMRVCTDRGVAAVIRVLIHNDAIASPSLGMDVIAKTGLFLGPKADDVRGESPHLSATALDHTELDGAVLHGQPRTNHVSTATLAAH